MIRSRHPLLPALALTFAFTSATFAACGKTPGAPATTTIAAGGTSGTFDTSLGWHVALDDAHIALGPIYVYAPEGDLTASLLAAVLPIARAHGGHDPLSGRQVRVEWLEQSAVDLLAPDTMLGDADGTAGMSDGLELLLDPPDAPNAAPLHGHHLWVSGVATKDGARVPFEGGLDIAAVSPISRVVEGVPLQSLVTSGGVLTVRVQLAQWLDQADFAQLTVPAAGPAQLLPDTQPYVAWHDGARSAAAFVASYTGAP